MGSRRRLGRIPQVSGFCGTFAYPHNCSSSFEMWGQWYGGRPLAVAVGDDLVSRGIILTSAYGSTELGAMNDSFRDIGTKYDWEWIRLSDHVTARWIPQEQNLFELHVMASDTQPMATTNLPDGAGYATGDLFVKHPTIEGLWKLSVLVVLRAYLATDLGTVSDVPTAGS
jgi:hypothetical protein